MKMWLRLLVGLLPFGFTSCIIGGLAPTTRHVPFSEQDFAGYDRAGSGSIRGQVSADYQGNHYISQGEQVALLPITPYTSEMVTRELGYGVLLTQPDLRFRKYARYTRTDNN